MVSSHERSGAERNLDKKRMAQYGLNCCQLCSDWFAADWLEKSSSIIVSGENSPWSDNRYAVNVPLALALVAAVTAGPGVNGLWGGSSPGVNGRWGQSGPGVNGGDGPGVGAGPRVNCGGGAGPPKNNGDGGPDWGAGPGVDGGVGAGPGRLFMASCCVGCCVSSGPGADGVQSSSVTALMLKSMTMVWPQ